MHVRTRTRPTIARLLSLAIALTLLGGGAIPAPAPAAAAKVKHKLTCRQVRHRVARHLPLRTHRARVKLAQCKRAHRHAVQRKQLALQQQPGQQQSSNPAAPSGPVAPVAAPIAASASAPPPPPPPGAHGTGGGWNGYSVNAWPGGDWRPYADSSPFNQQLSSSPAVHPSSAAYVQQILSWGAPGSLTAGTGGTTSDYGHPTYWAQPSDPLYTLHATSSRNAIEGMQIRIPAAAQPAGGSDGHMTVVEPDGWEYDFWEAQRKPTAAGTFTFAIGGRTRIDGSGLGAPATASNFGNLGGVIRAQELAAGHINHALFVVLKCTSTGTGFGYGTKAGSDDQASYVYPASHGGGGCSSSESASVPPMGARLQLAMSDSQIAALAVPAWKKTVLTALAHYGGYVGDTGGPGFGLQFESSTMYTVFGVTDPLTTFAQSAGLRASGGRYTFDIASGVDWARYLRVLTPPS